MSVERKLASIRTVDAVSPLPKADRLERASVGGWRCVVGKGEFTAGDPCVFFEIDSFLPLSNPRFAFLSPHASELDGVKGARLRTMEIRGALSQGLAMPISKFPEFSGLPVGTDVSSSLSVLKWEEDLPEDFEGRAKGYLPARLVRTSQERIQNSPELLLDDEEWEATQKLDGHSMTVYTLGSDSGVCSHRVDLLDTEGCPYWLVSKRQRILETLLSIGGEWSVQGELMGPGIRDNREGLPGPRFFLFNVDDLSAGRTLPPAERHAFAERMRSAGADVPEAPVLFTAKPSSWSGMDEALAAADGPSSVGQGPREGVVMARLSDGASFKIISNGYLLKADKHAALKGKPKGPV